MLDEAMWPDEWPATTNTPFRSSRAAACEGGAVGIRFPQSKVVAGLTDLEVSAGLGAVRDFLITTNLSSQTLYGPYPVTTLNLLAPGDLARQPSPIRAQASVGVAADTTASTLEDFRQASVAVSGEASAVP
ncbi:hypothetical protein ACIG8S_29980 [[Kitasatospora] papulosa]|uniref:hypothetical protein n=1 Tax=[Kitasatospora] papulosa TaxID=1464011 RepID=UPI0037CDF64D